MYLQTGGVFVWTSGWQWWCHGRIFSQRLHDPLFQPAWVWASSNEYIFCHHEHSWHGEPHVQSSFKKVGEAHQMVTVLPCMLFGGEEGCVPGGERGVEDGSRTTVSKELWGFIERYREGSCAANLGTVGWEEQHALYRHALRWRFCGLQGSVWCQLLPCQETGMCEPLRQKDGYSSEEKSQGGTTWWASLWCTHCQPM